MLLKRRKVMNGGRSMRKTPRSVVAEGLDIKGELASAGEIRIDGSVEGSLKAPCITVGPTGAIKGNIDADLATIEGTVNGEIKAKAVILAHTARVTGDVYHVKLRIQPGATVDGRYQPLEPVARTVDRAIMPDGAAAAPPTESKNATVAAAVTMTSGQADAAPLDDASGVFPFGGARRKTAIVLGTGVAMLAILALTKPQVGSSVAATDMPGTELAAGGTSAADAEIERRAVVAEAAPQANTSPSMGAGIAEPAVPPHKPRQQAAPKPMRERKAEHVASFTRTGATADRSATASVPEQDPSSREGSIVDTSRRDDTGVGSAHGGGGWLEPVAQYTRADTN
jgi:cytoskeletal protein CcmA (bactofilin family)